MEQILKVNGSIFQRSAFVICIIGAFSAGCASYNVQTKKISQSYELGNIQAAAAQISAEADKRGEGKDAIVWRLEQGAVLKAAGKLEESNHAFDKAEELINKFEEAAKISVSREALATVTNLTTLPYEGFAYDKIMMNTYKAMNYLQLNDFDRARVEFIRMYERQKDALYVNKARIEKAQDEGKKQNLQVDLDKIGNDARFQNQFASTYGNLEQYKAYADYVNPLAVYLEAIFFMMQGTGNSDFERSRNSFERVLSMIGENKFIRQDLETIEQIINGQQIPATTYVFFETGLVPEREQIRIDLPLFLITPGVPYVGAAFPKLKFRDDYVSVLNISYGGITEPTLLLSDMDNVVAREFKNELPIVITKTLIASAIKAGGIYGAYTGVTKGGKKNAEVAGLAVLLAGSIYQAAMNQADLRTWTTLPKEFQFCRFYTPADRKIELEAPYSGYKIPVTIDSGLVNVVWVKSINRGSPLLVSQLKLKDEIKGVVPPPPAETTAPKEVPLQEPSTHEQTIKSTDKQSSIKQELPLDTAIRMERERFLAIDETKKQQIASLHREILKDFEKQDWNAVVQKCKKSLEFDPEDYFAYGNSGAAYAMLNEFDLSIEYSTKASQLIPALPDAYMQMVYAYARKGDKDLAFESLQKAVDRGYNDINLLRNDTDLPEDFRKDPRLNNYN